MAEQQYDPISFDAWDSDSTFVFKVTESRSLLVRRLDAVSLMAVTDGNMPNPLLALIIKAAGGQNQKAAQNVGAELVRDEKTLADLVASLNRMMLDVVISPPLLENGSEKGISVNQIPFAAKMEIFYELVGLGDKQLDKLETFRKEQSPVLQSRPASKTVRKTS